MATFVKTTDKCARCGNEHSFFSGFEGVTVHLEISDKAAYVPLCGDCTQAVRDFLGFDKNGYLATLSKALHQENQ